MEFRGGKLPSMTRKGKSRRQTTAFEEAERRDSRRRREEAERGRICAHKLSRGGN